MKKALDANNDAIRELVMTVELLRSVCEHAEGKRGDDKGRLTAGMVLGMRVAAKYGRTYLPDYQQPAFWDEAHALLQRYVGPLGTAKTARVRTHKTPAHPATLKG